MNRETIIKITCLNYKEKGYFFAKYNRVKNILSIRCSGEFIDDLIETLESWQVEIYYRYI